MIGCIHNTHARYSCAVFWTTQPTSKRSHHDDRTTLSCVVFHPPQLNNVVITHPRLNLSVCSVCVRNAGGSSQKAARLSDIITDNRLDAVAICEMWITDTAPDTIKLGLDPPGFAIFHITDSLNMGPTVVVDLPLSQLMTWLFVRTHYRRQ